MKSIILKSSSTTTISNQFTKAFVLDTDGEPLFNGRQYYMIPQTPGFGGLITTTKYDDTPCPYYVTRDKDETSNGMPLTISAPLKILYIPESSSVSIAFQEMMTTVCTQSMGWRVVPGLFGKLYVATGGSSFNWEFSIEKAEGDESRNNVYNISFNENESSKGNNVGIFKLDGLLCITHDEYDIPLTFMFKKAFKEEISSTSS